MNVQQFIAEFGHIAKAPGGVARLRELVLQLAISGRLTILEQDDTPAAKLIEKNLETQLDLIRRRKLKQQPAPQPVALVPWSLPRGWAWTRLGAVTNYGDAPKVEFSDVTQDTWVLELEDIEKGTSKLLTKVLASERKFKSTKNGFPSGAVLYGKLRPYLDKVLVADDAGVCSTEISPISFFQGIDSRYLRWYLKSPYFIAYASGSTYGMNLPRMSTGSAREALFPFPPAKEQSRIVDKVDELMALCDRLEAQQTARSKLQTGLRQAILQSIAAATSSTELQAAWTRLSDNFSRLFSDPGDVDDLAVAIKSLAVRGVLTESSPQSVDLDAIRLACTETRNSYIRSGLMRRQKRIDVTAAEATYPQHWAVTAFDELAIVIGGVTKGRQLRGQDAVTCPYLAVANVQRGYFKLRDLKTIQIASAELEKYKVDVGDLLITEGGDWDKVGRTAIWEGGIENCLHQNHVFKARVPSNLLSNEWVELVFNSDIGRNYFAGASKQTTNLASINMTQLRSFPFPIPSLAEQKAILDALAVLMQQCREWKGQLERRQVVAALLTTTLISALTGIAVDLNEEPVKPPKTELLAPLHLGQSPSIKDQDIAPLAAILAHQKKGLNAKDLWQRYGGEIDAFYAQLKTEVANGWIHEPEPAVMNEIHDEIPGI